MSWNQASNGNTWQHIFLDGCYAIDPLDGAPPIPRPSNLLGSPYVGIIASDAYGTGFSASRLAIMPFDPQSERFELRGKVWFERDDPNPAQIDIYLAQPGTSPQITDPPQIKLTIEVGAFAGMMQATLTISTSSNSSWKSSPTVSSVVGRWIDVVIRGTKSSGAVEAFVGDNLYLSLSTPNVVTGIMGLSNPCLRLDTMASGTTTTTPYTCAFDDFRMVEITSVGPPVLSDTPMYGHTCETFQGPAQVITLSSKFAPSSCEVWVNGVFLNSFSEDEGTNSVNLGFVPDSTDIVRVCYLAVGAWA